MKNHNVESHEKISLSSLSLSDCWFVYSSIFSFYFVNREREMRIAARNEALQTATEQLQLKIQQKVKKANSDDANKM